MANKQDITAGKAFVELAVKDAKFKAGLKAASQRMQAFGASLSQAGRIMTGLGGAIAAPLAVAVGSFGHAGAAMSKLSSQTGATVKDLGRMKYMADSMGVDFDDLVGSIEELNIRLGETVRDGVGPAAEAFKQLGLDAGKLNRMGIEDRGSNKSVRP